MTRNGIQERRKPRKLKEQKRNEDKDVYVYIPDEFSAEKHPKCK